MRVLVTGINGFAGSHLVDYIVENHKEVEIHGTIRSSSNLDNLQHVTYKIKLHSVELTDIQSIISLLRSVVPDKIFHLAAQSTVMKSFEDPINTMQTNVLGTLNLLEAIRKTNMDCIVQVCSSSEVYGQVSEDKIPIKEDTPFYPVNPYGVSKVAVDRLAFQYFQTYGLKTIITRAFPHTGPRRNPIFAESSFAKQLIEIENGESKPIYVGNLDSIRTFLDVRDMVEAYWVATEKCAFGDAYNIGSETPVTMNALLTKLISLSRTEAYIKKDDKLLRPTDISNHIPNTSKFRNQTKWNPKIPLEKTLADLLNYWRSRLGNNDE
ncbi:MAG: GDP-mannose 4,6-dehydratase [Thermoproteota archaeon]